MIRLITGALTGALGAPNIVSISNALSVAGQDQTAAIVFGSTGNFARNINGSQITTGTWLTPQTNTEQYEIRFTSTSGDPPTTGTLDTWQVLSTTRSITMTSTTEDEVLSGMVLAEIRWTGNNQVQSSATYTLTAFGPTSLEP